VTGVFALCAIANVALNVWLIPREGAVGAAIATVATELVELTAFAMLVQARLGSVRPALAGLTAAALAGVGAGSFFPDGIARIAASVGAFATVAFVVKRRDLVFA
jgi:O-antigen/teichoic acid export membrane protein